MELTHHFHVPSGVEETWAHFQDVAGLAGCFPGAQVTSADGDEFIGSCKVKLGPIALLYNGTGEFTQRDAESHRLVVEAKGKDKRGNGTAAATATLTMAPASSGGTDVNVVTDLSITGKPAQFGRGLMQDVSDRLLDQFVTCLAQQLTPAEAAVEPAAPSAAVTYGVARSEPLASDPEEPAAIPDATPPPQPSAPASPAAPPGNDALNLGATVLPVLVKSYWKPAAVTAAAAAVVIAWLISR